MNTPGPDMHARKRIILGAIHATVCLAFRRILRLKRVRLWKEETFKEGFDRCFKPDVPAAWWMQCCYLLLPWWVFQGNRRYKWLNSPFHSAIWELNLTRIMSFTVGGASTTVYALRPLSLSYLSSALGARRCLFGGLPGRILLWWSHWMLNSWSYANGQRCCI